VKQSKQQQTGSLWENSPTANLVRYKPSGVYFARARIAGKLIRKSLGTTVYSVAVLKLANVLKEHRQIAAGACSCHQAADLVRFLAYGGFRKKEAAGITWADVRFNDVGDGGEVIVRDTKNGDARTVPMIPPMVELLKRMRTERPDTNPESPVTLVKECQVTMDKAAKKIGMQPVTHHDLRHLFATTCIEAGVDVPTVARWLGHQDGGVLAMRVYTNHRKQHSTQQARRVQFADAPAENAVQLPQEKAG